LWVLSLVLPMYIAANEHRVNISRPTHELWLYAGIHMGCGCMQLFERDDD